MKRKKPIGSRPKASSVAEKYMYRISPTPTGGFAAICVELNMVHRAATANLALDGAVLDASRELKWRRQHNQSIPVPLSLRNFTGKIAVRVPPDLHRTLVAEAAAEGVSMNRLIERKLATSRSRKP